VTAPVPTKATSWSTVADRLNDALEGEYIIERELGRGGMAAVFLAYEPALDRRVAIKVMSPGLMPDESMVQRFRQEAVTVAHLNHPNIITVHAVRTVGDLHCFVMKFVVGRPLGEILGARGALPIPVVRHVLCEVGSALAYAHRQQVIHRDIKPANIMMDSSGEAMVTDFGIAKVAEATTHTQTGAAVGTPQYMSPEQCRGGEITWAADQYALGIVAYEMLTGSVPFAGTTFAVMRAHIEQTPAPITDRRPDCPPELDAAIQRMLAKTPAERWPSMSAALQAAGAQDLAEDDPVRAELARWATEGLDVTIVRGAPSPVPRGQLTQPVAARLAITAPGEVMVGEAVALRLTAWNARGAEVQTSTVVWASDAPNIIRIDDAGRATAVAPGAAILRATVGDSRAAISINVSRPIPATVPAGTVVPTPIPVSPPKRKAKWPWVILGIVVAIGVGVGAGIMLWAPPATDQTTIPAPAPLVIVPAHGVRFVAIEGAEPLGVGQSAKLKGMAYDANQRPVRDVEFAWTSDDPTIATVDPKTGRVKALATGAAHIHAAADGREATVVLTVR
jgi:eukaryotic-like serine/threonine-protein kinase